ncbi:MAG: Na+/H+ antiporter [Chitinophagaceae bacterium]
MHGTFIGYLYILLAILFLVMLAGKLKIAYPIVLVLGGLALSFVPGLPNIQIDPDLIFIIFLPPLLYEAAWQTSWKDFWKWRRVISSFAFLIVIVTACVVAFVSSSLIPGFTLALGFLLGGIVSPPDAVSATTILRNIKVPKRLITIVEGESLLNDASSLVVFRFALVAVESGKFVFHQATLSFFIVIIMGIVTGIVIALIFYAIHRWLPTTANIDIILTFITPYMMYIVAEQFHFSGVLAVVSGGLFLSIRNHQFLSQRSRIQGVNVWSTIAFAMNGLIFMLIGLELPFIVGQLGPVKLSDAIRYSLIISFVLIITRLICTFGAALFTRVISHVITTADSNPSMKDSFIFGWAGMRGVVSLAAALSIPLYLADGKDFPQRNLILFITFVVILVTLVFQGLTLPWLVRIVKMEEKDYLIPHAEQEMIVRRKMSKAALNLLNEKYQTEVNRNGLLRSLKLKMESDVKMLERLQNSEPDDNIAEEFFTEYYIIYQDVIRQQRDLLHKMNTKAEIEEEIVRKHLALLDMEQEKMRQIFNDQPEVS